LGGIGGRSCGHRHFRIVAALLVLGNYRGLHLHQLQVSLGWRHCSGLDLFCKLSRFDAAEVQKSGVRTVGECLVVDCIRVFLAAAAAGFSNAQAASACAMLALRN
jgi:hypothetical protein